MSPEIITKKLDQIELLLQDLENLFSRTFDILKKDTTFIRAAERNFQLIVDLASDINTQLLIEKGQKTPDTYKQSFAEMWRIGALSDDLSRQLTESAKIRNILVHEYDFEEDCEKFYRSAKLLLPAFREYTRRIYKYIQKD